MKGDDNEFNLFSHFSSLQTMAGVLPPRQPTPPTSSSQSPSTFRSQPSHSHEPLARHPRASRQKSQPKHGWVDPHYESINHSTLTLTSSKRGAGGGRNAKLREAALVKPPRRNMLRQHPHTHHPPPETGRGYEYGYRGVDPLFAHNEYVQYEREISATSPHHIHHSSNYVHASRPSPNSRSSQTKYRHIDHNHNHNHNHNQNHSNSNSNSSTNNKRMNGGGIDKKARGKQSRENPRHHHQPQLDTDSTHHRSLRNATLRTQSQSSSSLLTKQVQSAMQDLESIKSSDYKNKTPRARPITGGSRERRGRSRGFRPQTADASMSTQRTGARNTAVTEDGVGNMPSLEELSLRLNNENNSSITNDLNHQYKVNHDHTHHNDNVNFNNTTTKSTFSSSFSSPRVHTPNIHANMGIEVSGAGADMAMLKGVMQKLYRKNVELGKEVQELRDRSSSDTSATTTGTTLSSTEGPAAGTIPLHDNQERRLGENDRGESKGSSLDSHVEENTAASTRHHPRSKENYAKAHLHFSLSQRDQTIKRLREELSATSGRLQQLETQHKQIAFLGNMDTPDWSNSSGGINTGIPRRSPENDPYFRQFTALYNDYTGRLTQRLQRIQQSVSIPKEALYMITQLQRHLIDETVTRQVQRLMLSSQLNRVQQTNCEVFVEKRLLQKELAEMKEELRKRDDLERQVEQRVLGVLERVQYLEQENASLRKYKLNSHMREDTSSN